MGRHANEERGKTFAPWIITAAIAVLVVAIVAASYIAIMIRADSADQGVCKTAVPLSVAAGPSAARALTAAAAAYNETNPVVRSACITASVTAVPDSAALNGFTTRWSTKNGPQPGMWIPSSAASLAALDAVRPDLIAGHATEPFAWSPVVLATSSADAAALSGLSWSDILSAAVPATGQQLADGRSVTLVSSAVLENRAVSYVLQSGLSGAAAEGPVSSDTISVHSSTIRTAVGSVGEAATTDDALAALAGDSSTGASAADTVVTVPVVEADLVRFDQRTTSAPLTAVHPAGSTVGDALIGAAVSAPWTDRTITAAASDFQAFLIGVAGQQILADHGWRTISAHPSDPMVQVDTHADVTMIPAGGPAVDQEIAVALGQAEPAPTNETATVLQTTTQAPATTSTEPTESTSSPPPSTVDPVSTGPVLTLIIDTSAGMAEKDHGTSLIDWVKKAIPDLIDGSVTDRIGLWVYSDGEIYPPTGAPELVPVGLITKTVEITEPGSDTPTREVRSTALSDAIAALQPDGERWAYSALMEALPKAAKAAKKNRANRVILMTSGGDDTPGTLRRQVLDAVRASASDLRLDVVGLGGSVPVDAYTDIAAACGGEYIPVLDPANLGQQLVDFLTLGD